MEVFIGLLVTVLLLVYFYLTSTYDYWRKKKIPGPKPSLIFGTIKDLIFGRKFIGCYLKDVYDEYPEDKMVGIFAMREPVLVLKDVDLIKQVLIKDFRCFMDRGFETMEKSDPLADHLFNIEGKRWKPLRSKLTPIFSSGKLKEMFHLMINCTKSLETFLEQNEGKTVDIKDMAANFTTNIIGSCAYGLDAKAFGDEESEFRRIGKMIFNLDWKTYIRVRIRRFAPSLLEYLGDLLIHHDIDQFFTGLWRDTLKYRKENGDTRFDLVSLLAALNDDPSKVDDLELTDNLMAAQLFIFFIGGFETSASTISNCIYELAMNQTVQEKLRQEINDELEKTDGEITYEGIKNMKYLDMVLNETLRMYPPVSIILRKTTEPYKFSGTDVTIPTGTRVWIPNFALQRDPKYFPDPEVFDPKRFSDEAVRSFPSMAYLPFGNGPRNCIGLRFAQIQTKIGIIKVLQNYKVDSCEKTMPKYKISPAPTLLTPEGGISVLLTKVE